MQDTNSTPSTEGSLSDLPRADGGGGLGTLSLPWNRRQFLGRAFAGAVAISLASLDVLPPSRWAYADHEGTSGYHIKPLPCPDYASDHGCYPGCGDSHVCSGTDGPCCVPTGDHKFGWHKGRGYGGGNYDIRHNECIPPKGEHRWDGWKWKLDGGCGFCDRGITYRCHDGWEVEPNGTFGQKLICRHVVQCDF